MTSEEHKEMSEEVEEHKKLTENVKVNLRRANGMIANYQHTNTWLLTATIVSSAASTLVAGLAATIGPPMGIEAAGWRAACILAAIFGFIATVSTGLSQQLKISDRLFESKQAMGRLRYLDVVMTTGSKSWGEITKEYEEIAKAYPDVIL